jgi:hypothetical protein
MAIALVWSAISVCLRPESYRRKCWLRYCSTIPKVPSAHAMLGIIAPMIRFKLSTSLQREFGDGDSGEALLEAL